MNRMKIYIYCCLSVMLFGLSACENELELDTKTASKQLSVNGFINADSTVNRLLVSFTGIDHPTIVTDATIKVSVNGNLRETVHELPAGSEQYIIHGRFNPGDHVRIEVSTPDNNYQASIEETVPQPIDKIERISTGFVKDVSYVDEYEMARVDDLQKINLSFQDNGKQADYYRLTLAGYQTIMNTQFNYTLRRKEATYRYFVSDMGSSYIATGDPIIMEGRVCTPSTDMGFASPNNVVNQMGVFNDLLFNGQECSISVYSKLYQFNRISDPEMKTSLDLVATISSYTSAAYYYLKAMNLKKSTYYDDYNDLTGPIKMPSNVKGGTGLVGFYTSKSIPVHVYGTDRYPHLYE